MCVFGSRKYILVSHFQLGYDELRSREATRLKHQETVRRVEHDPQDVHDVVGDVERLQQDLRHARLGDLLEVFGGDDVVGLVNGILRARVEGEAYVGPDVGAASEGMSWS